MGRGGRGGRSAQGSQGGRGRGSRPHTFWRYVKPADATKPFNSTDGKQWWWCDLCNRGNGAYSTSHDTDGSLSGTKHDPNKGKISAPATNLAEGETALDLIPSVSTGQPVRTPPVEAGSLSVIDLLFQVILLQAPGYAPLIWTLGTLSTCGSLE